MKPLLFLLLLQVAVLSARSQKIPMDHTVYDGWQSLGEKLISSDGKTVVYTINPQEGDGLLVIEQTATGRKQEIGRGYHAFITPDSRFVVGLIKPFFKDTREARIKKKKPEEMPKDSLFLFEVKNGRLIKAGNVKSYKMPQKGSGWLAWLAEKPLPDLPGKAPADSLTLLNNLSLRADSLVRVADSLRKKESEARLKGMAVLQPAGKAKGLPGVKSSEEKVEEGTMLTLRNLFTGEEVRYPRVSEYVFSKKGDVLVVETTRKKDDSLSKAFIGWVGLGQGLKTDTVMKGFNEARNIALDEEAGQLAFVVEKDSSAKALRKFYSCWYYRPGMDSAVLIVDRHTPGMTLGSTVSENYELNFSKSGRRLFLGLAPIRPVKDTTVPDFEKAGLDVWNYKDDELQPVQLKNLDRELKRSWLASWDPGRKELVKYGNDKFPQILVTKEGDGETFYAGSDSGKRVALQWQGFTLKDIYAVDAGTGMRKLIVADFKGSLYPSYTGKYLLLYDDRKRGYSVYNSETGSLYPVARDILYPLYDEENDVPDEPGPYGIAGWEKDDKHVYVYDRYSIWRVDPAGKEHAVPANVTIARTVKISFRYVKVDPEEKFIDPGKPAYLRLFYEKSKISVYEKASLEAPWSSLFSLEGGPYSVNGLTKADSADTFLYTRESYNASPDLYLTSVASDSNKAVVKPASLPGWHSVFLLGNRLSHLNPQQSGYNWGTAELFTWKAYSGRLAEGVLYKPENFDSARKYPMIVYYYERNSNTLFSYQPPAPTPSRLNIPFFVSRGYIVFVPDIWYKTGHPGQSAYDYVMSGTRALIKKGFVDSTKMGLQGQSWGGYQTAYLITRTNLFAAAWAGAPVVNMFSAYGGIRWESGLNRQMQYERSQSRIGATIWERPDLYVENSPLFHLPAVKTPLVIMSNDADGAVPWYQGIEFFTAMRRLNKPVWLLEYNGEAHNLVERRNRKDIQIREQQFFDWLLKGDKPPKWITGGVPATLKGIDWGTDLE
jgi:dipeptidyl aminopeptidase/acylaminoacyl peptidase